MPGVSGPETRSKVLAGLSNRGSLRVRGVTGRRLLDLRRLVAQSVVECQLRSDAELILSKQRVLAGSEIQQPVAKCLGEGLPVLARPGAKDVDRKRVEI